MALEQAEMSHPEVAAGLVASVIEPAAGTPLLPDAVRLFTRSLAQGGDCRLLRGLTPERMPPPERRALLLAAADCARSAGQRELSRNLLFHLLEENREDEPGRLAAERLAALVSTEEHGRTPMLLGLAFHLHRELERALLCLAQALGRGNALSLQDELETMSAQAQIQLWQKKRSSSSAKTAGSV